MRSHLPEACYLCGETVGLTDEHLPPVNLFPRPRPADLVTVRACQPHNGGFSLADEYFRIAVLGPAALSDATAKELWEGPIVRGLLRSVKRRAGFAIEFLESWKEFDIHDRTGGLVGKEPARLIRMERIRPTVERIVRGLIWLEYEHRRPAADVTFHIEIGRVRNSDTEGLARRLLHCSAVPRSVAGGIFQYWYYGSLENPQQSDWLLTFYRAIGFLVRLTPPGQVL